MKLKKYGIMDLLVVDQILLWIIPKVFNIFKILKTHGQVLSKIVLKKVFFVLKNAETFVSM